MDTAASVVRPAEELIGFKRVSLEPGESKTVCFTFNLDILSFYNEPGHWILEKGEFIFYLGKNSKEAIVSGTVYADATREIDHQNRCLIAQVSCE